MPSVIPSICLTLLLTCAARAAVIRTLDGKAHEGDVRLTADGLEIQPPAGGDLVKVPLADVLRVDQRPVASLTAAPPPQVKKEDPEQARWSDVSKWEPRDVGQSRPPGRFAVRRGLVEIEAGGEEIGGPSEAQDGDRFFFVHRPLPGDGAIIAKVAALAVQEKAPRAGLMVRDGLDRHAPNLMLSLTGHKTYFQSRSTAGGPTRRDPCGDAQPKWMKISRSGSRFTAWISSDGADWQKVGEQKLAVGPEALVGLAVASRREGAAAEVTFEGVSVTTDTDAPVSAPPTPKPWEEKVVERGIIFRDGSVIAAEIRSADDTSVRFVRRGRSEEQSVPLADVSRLLLRKPRRPAEAPAEPGVVLTGGDFVEGHLKSMKDGQLLLSSVLFGLRRLDLNRDVATIILRPSAPGRAAYEIEMRDGSLILASDVTAKSGELVMNAEVLGAMKLAWADIEELRVGAARLVSLGDLNVAKASGREHYAINAMPGGHPIELAGQRHDRGLGMTAGATVEWDINAKYSVLIGSAGVPSALLPASPVRFIVMGDGSELWRSPPRSSLDAPQPIAVTVKGVKRLALRVEADGGALPSAGAWTNMALVTTP